MVADRRELPEVTARQAAPDPPNGFRRPGREVKALADAARMYWWATTARWVPEGTAGRAGRLMLVCGGVGR